MPQNILQRHHSLHFTFPLDADYLPLDADYLPDQDLLATMNTEEHTCGTWANDLFHICSVLFTDRS